MSFLKISPRHITHQEAWVPRKANFLKETRNLSASTFAGKMKLLSAFHREEREEEDEVWVVLLIGLSSDRLSFVGMLNKHQPLRIQSCCWMIYTVQYWALIDWLIHSITFEVCMSQNCCKWKRARKLTRLSVHYSPFTLWTSPSNLQLNPERDKTSQTASGGRALVWSL